MIKILLVDDNPGDQRLAKDSMKEAGIEAEVTTASSADECFKLVETLKPDLFILDVMMPKMSGYDLCYTLKYDMAYKTPIIMLTSRDQEIDPRIGKLMGVYYLQKPCTAMELKGIVDKIFK